MGHREHRPYISRRDFLKRAGVVGAAIATGPTFWKQLAYAAETPVTQRHLVFGADPTSQMTVSWVTAEPVQAPFVELATGRFAAETVQYPGYPGFIHHAELTGLNANAAYEYAIGHADQVRSATATFRTAPVGRHAFTFTAFGDQGTDLAPVPEELQIFSLTPTMQCSANTKLADSMNPALHLIVGDLSYANGDQAIWDEWFTMIEPMASRIPWMPCLGNHEIEAIVGDSWGEFGYDPYRFRYVLPSNGYEPLRDCYYAFRYGSVAFLMLDNNDVNSEIGGNIGYTGGRQVAWAEGVLAAAAADPEIDFIVVGMHQCAFSSSTKHGSDEGVQATWLPLFDRYEVDLVIQGHDHTYERSHGMKGTTVAERRAVTEPQTYRSDRGTVFVVAGNGGAVQEPFHPVQPEWSAFRQALRVGTLRVDVDPFAPGGMRRMTLTERAALDGSVIEGGIVLERPSRH